MTLIHLALILTGIAFLIFVRKVFERPIIGLYGAIFASGFLITVHLPVVREKLTVCELAILATWASMLALATVGRFRPSPLTWPQRVSLRVGGLFVLVVLLSFLVNGIREQRLPLRSLVETANYLYGVLLFGTVVLLVDTWKKWNHCIDAWCLAAAVVSVIGVLALAGMAPAWAVDDVTGRVSSTLRKSNQLPAFGLPILPLVVIRAVHRGTRLWSRAGYFALAGGIGISVLATGSRTGMLMLLLCLLGIIAVGIVEVRRRAFSRPAYLLVCSVLAGGLLAFLMFAWYEMDRSRRGKPWRSHMSPVYRPVVNIARWMEGEKPLSEPRARQIRKVWTYFAQRPVVGCGPARFTVMFQEHEVHNTYLGVLVEEGVVGLVLLLWFLALVYQNGLLALRAKPGATGRLLMLGAMLGLATLLTYGLFMFGLRQRYFWFMCGLVAALPRVLREERAASTAAVNA